MPWYVCDGPIVAIRGSFPANGEARKKCGFTEQNLAYLEVKHGRVSLILFSFGDTNHTLERYLSAILLDKKNRLVLLPQTLCLNLND